MVSRDTVVTHFERRLSCSNRISRNLFVSGGCKLPHGKLAAKLDTTLASPSSSPEIVPFHK
jgi:hypothetical protein